MKDQQVKDIRLASQHLSLYEQHSPQELVSWMGAIQAQSFQMAKWAIGIRLNVLTQKAIDEAFNNGDIIRTHVLRPTWHFVDSRDLRWLLLLTGNRIKTACTSFIKKLNITTPEYLKYCDSLKGILSNNSYLTKDELATYIAKSGQLTISNNLNLFLLYAEVDGII